MAENNQSESKSTTPAKESSRRKKTKDPSTLPDNIKKELQEARYLENFHYEKSGYPVWRKYFITGYLSYSFVLYFAFLRKVGMNTPKNLIPLFAPVFPYGWLLMKVLVNHEEYKNYHKAHIQMNRLIKIHIQGKSAE